MKKIFTKLFLVAIAAVALPAFAQTAQLPASATITAVKDANGNAVVTWTGVQIIGAEVYIGHGQRGGYVQKMSIGAATQLVLKDADKNGGRFNLIVADGRFLHLECGGNDRTTMPSFKGLVVDCSYVDPKSGQKLGALVLG